MFDRKRRTREERNKKSIIGGSSLFKPGTKYRNLANITTIQKLSRKNLKGLNTKASVKKIDNKANINKAIDKTKENHKSIIKIEQKTLKINEFNKHFARNHLGELYKKILFKLKDISKKKITALKKMAKCQIVKRTIEKQIVNHRQQKSIKLDGGKVLYK